MIVFAQFMFEYSNTAKIPYAIMYKNCLFKLHKFDILTDKLLNTFDYMGKIGKIITQREETR